MGQRNHKMDPTFRASMGLNWEMLKVQLQPCLVIIWELFPFPNQGGQFGNWLVPKVISRLDPSLTQFSTWIAPVSVGWEFTNISCEYTCIKL